MVDILVGTTKGLFILEDRGGRRFALTGPFCDGRWSESTPGRRSFS